MAVTPYRIWSILCPFTKKGFPRVHPERRDLQAVVILCLETWTQLCRDIPALGQASFEEGELRSQDHPQYEKE